MAEWLSMGGYAVYVWSSFGLTAVVLAGGVIASVMGMRQQRTALRRLREFGDDA